MNIQKLIRCKTIIDAVEKNRYPMLSEIHSAVNTMLQNMKELNGEGIDKVDERTIKRDIEDIRRILRIDIVYASSEKGYYIDENEVDSNENYALMEAANFIFVLQNMKNIRNFIEFEPRKARKGSEHFFAILSALRKKKKIEIKYLHYEKKEVKKRLLSPLGLKEFKGFWYLIANDEEGIKTFGLDRIIELYATDKKSAPIKDFNLNEYYEHCFGIVRFKDEAPQEIEIWTTPIKASYYKANPLHESQKVIEETEEYTVFSIYAYLTYDLQQELRSHGEEHVKVLKPKDGLLTKRYY